MCLFAFTSKIVDAPRIRQRRYTTGVTSALRYKLVVPIVVHRTAQTGRLVPHTLGRLDLQQQGAVPFQLHAQGVERNEGEMSRLVHAQSGQVHRYRQRSFAVEERWHPRLVAGECKLLVVHEQLYDLGTTTTRRSGSASRAVKRYNRADVVSRLPKKRVRAVAVEAVDSVVEGLVVRAAPGEARLRFRLTHLEYHYAIRLLRHKQSFT